MLHFQDVSKNYQSGDKDLHVLRRINLNFDKGSVTALTGPSGSGKSTLLSLAAGIEQPTSGKILFLGHNLQEKSEAELAELRLKEIGFIFQSFQLIPSLTALENVELPGELLRSNNLQHRAKDLLAAVGLAERINHFPSQLSGGEQQRVAIARAFINQPQLLLADEPSGSLDAENSVLVIDRLFALNRELGTSLIIATHDIELAGRCGRIVRIDKGAIN